MSKAKGLANDPRLESDGFPGVRAGWDTRYLLRVLQSGIADI